MYTRITYYCPFPEPGQPPEVEAIVEGENEYERYLLYLAANVYPGRTDLHMGAKSLVSLAPRHVKAYREDGNTPLDLPPLPKDYVWPETTDAERTQFKRRQLALNTLNAMQSYWVQARKLEAELGDIVELADLLDTFNVGVDHDQNIGAAALDRLLAVLTKNLEGE